MPLLLPFAERANRFTLGTRGVRSRHHDTPHGRIHFFDAAGRGPGAPFVLLHGFGSSALPFRPMLLGLREKHRRVLAPEFPSHGLSSDVGTALRPEVIFESVGSVLDRELDEPAIVFGNSLGGALALRYAAANPSRVRALILTSPAGAPMSENELNTLTARFRMRDSSDARAFITDLYHRRPWFAPLIAADLQAVFARPALRAFLAATGPQDFFDPAMVAALTMPVLFIWGRSERILPPSGLAFFRETLPRSASIEEMEGAGHCPHIDQPARLLARIEAFTAALG